MKVFRALRTDELSNITKHGILPRCAPCPDSPCCNISEIQHITSGTKAKIKSRWISTTENEKVAAWYCANISGNPKDKSATYALIELDKNNNNIINTCSLPLGATGKNMAKASCEILVKDNIPIDNIKQIYRAKEIPKGIFDKLPNDIYTRNGFHFHKLTAVAQKKLKYILAMEVWHFGKSINFDLMNDIFPAITESLPVNIVKTFSNNNTKSKSSSVQYLWNHPHTKTKRVRTNSKSRSKSRSKSYSRSSISHKRTKY